MEREVRRTEHRTFVEGGNKSGEPAQLIYLSDDGEVLIGFKEPTLLEAFSCFPETLTVVVATADASTL